MTDPITIINLVFTGLSIILIPVIIKALDITHDLFKNVKRSKCCSCFEIERDNINDNLDDEKDFEKFT